MKAKNVLNKLKITRQTLCTYVKQSKIKVKLLHNKQYDYNEEDVYKLLGYKKENRKHVIYSRVSTTKQKNYLKNQIEVVEGFCNKNGIVINDIYKDIGSGINFEERKEFKKLLNDIIEYKIDTIYITYKDRLSRIGYKTFEELFNNYGTKIIVLNEIDDEKIIEKEIFIELISLIHSFSMKVYSNRRKEKLKLIEKDLSLEIENN